MNQDPGEVKAKFRKKIDTFYFPVGNDIKAVFVDWEAFLRKDKYYSMEDPLFPLTGLGHESPITTFTRYGQIAPPPPRRLDKELRAKEMSLPNIICNL